MLGDVGRVGGPIPKPFVWLIGETGKPTDGAENAVPISLSDSISPSLLELIEQFNRTLMPPDIRPLYGVPREDGSIIIRPLYGIPRDDTYPDIRPLYGIPRDDWYPDIRPLYGIPRPDHGVPDIRPLYGIPARW